MASVKGRHLRHAPEAEEYEKRCRHGTTDRSWDGPTGSISVASGRPIETAIFELPYPAVRLCNCKRRSFNTGLGPQPPGPQRPQSVRATACQALRKRGAWHSISSWLHQLDAELSAIAAGQAIQCWAGRSLKHDVLPWTLDWIGVSKVRLGHRSDSVARLLVFRRHTVARELGRHGRSIRHKTPSNITDSHSPSPWSKSGSRDSAAILIVRVGLVGPMSLPCFSFSLVHLGAWCDSSADTRY